MTQTPAHQEPPPPPGEAGAQSDPSDGTPSAPPASERQVVTGDRSQGAVVTGPRLLVRRLPTPASDEPRIRAPRQLPPGRRRPPSAPGSRRPSSPRPTGVPRRGPTRSRRGFRFADLFAGIGGFHLALTRAGGSCVFASEVNAAARRTYETNFAPVCADLFTAKQFHGDIRAVNPRTVPDFDVLTAGFPCQPFSRAGLQRGFDDDRGQLFFEIVRLLEAKRPAAYFLENVPGLQRLQGGRVLEVIRRSLTEELGYSFHLKVLRACDFGLPQLRPRLFIVGFRNSRTPFDFPEPVPLEFTMDDVFGGRCNRQIGYTILASGRDKPFGVDRSWDAYLVDGQLRRIGPHEARRMQGFPDSFILPDSVNLAMRQLGNAVAVPPAEATARQIATALGVGSDGDL